MAHSGEESSSLIFARSEDMRRTLRGLALDISITLWTLTAMARVRSHFMKSQGQRDQETPRPEGKREVHGQIRIGKRTDIQRTHIRHILGHQRKPHQPPAEGQGVRSYRTQKESRWFFFFPQWEGVLGPQNSKPKKRTMGGEKTEGLGNEV